MVEVCLSSGLKGRKGCGSFLPTERRELSRFQQTETETKVTGERKRLWGKGEEIQ